MKRKRRLKRISAFILAVALIIANCTPIFADEMSDAPEEVVPIIEPLTEEDLVVNDENNGDIVTPDVTPEVTKEVTPEITPVVPDVTEGVTPEITKEVTPGITEEVTTYTVTFVGLDDEVIATVSVKPDDEAVEYPTAPEKDGFIFTGWDKEINVKDLTENITVKALYDKVEANEVLVEREEQKTFGNKTVTVKGNIPKDAEVIISDVSSIERVENLLSDEVASDENVTITVHEAYDIKIMLDGEVWQPCEHDSVVTISIDNINTDKELNVHRIDGNDVTAITPAIEENNIIFETEHFTIFTVDTVEYNTDDGYFEAFGKVYNINDALKTNVAATSGSTKIYGYLYDDLYAIPTNGIALTDVKLKPTWSDSGINKADLEGKKLFIGDNVFSGIGQSAFNGCSGLTGDLIIPDGVTSIGILAFYGCSGLTGNLTIPDGVTTIGTQAFAKCTGLTGNLNIPNSVTSIGTSAFQYCSSFTGNLVIPNRITSIGAYAFQYCSGFTGNLTIPDSVTSIGSGAFDGCSGFTGNLTIPDSVTSIGSDAFDGCSGFTGNLTIPDGVTSIGDRTFSDCSGFTGDLVIPNSVTSIGSNAFAGCTSLTGNLNIPNSVTSIGTSAFYGCSGFTGNLNISSSVTNIGNSAFYNCSKLKSIILENVTITNDIGDNTHFPTMYTNNGRGDVITKLEAGVTYNDTLYYKELRDVTYTNDGATSGSAPEAHIGIVKGSKITLSTGTLVKENYILAGWSDGTNTYDTDATITVNTDITLSPVWELNILTVNGITYKKSEAIKTNVAAVKDGTTIYGYLFDDLYAIPTNGITLTDVTLSPTWSDSGINKADLEGKKLFIGDNVFTSIGAGAFYQCSGFTGDLVIPDSVTSIGVNAFRDCSGFDGTLNIPSSVTNIGDNAFDKCSGLTGDLVIPDSVTSIGAYAFQNCSGFNGTLTLSNSLTEIPNNAFLNCSGLTGNLVIPDSVTTIGYAAFNGCSGLTGTLNIPNSVTSIGQSAFGVCKGLTGDLVIPDNVTEIGSSAFSGCKGFTGTLNIPSSVTSISGFVFSGCSGLTGDLVIPDSVTSIGGSAFSGCSNIETITIPSSVTYIGYRPFSSKYVKLDNVTITNNENYTFANTAGSSWTYYYANSGRGNSIKKLEPNVLYNDTFARERIIETFQTNDGTTYNINDAIKKNIVATYNDTEIYGYLFDDLYAIPTDISRLNDVRSAGVALTINPVWSDEGVNKSELSGKKLYIGYNIFKSVGDNAFKNCPLTGSLDLSSTNINSIGAHAFENNDFNGWLNLPWTITSLGEYAFADNANLGGSVSYNWTTVPDGLFKNCGISSIWLSSPTSIGAEAFKDTNISSIQIPSSVTSIGKDAFDGIMSVSFDNVTITNDIGDDTHFNTTMYANVGRGEGIRKLEPNVLYNDTYVDYQLFNVTYLTDGADSGEAPSGVIDWRSTEDYTIKDNNTLAKSGYTFKCWIDTDGVTYNAGKVLKLTKTLNLSPVWDRIIPTYTVTYLGTGSTSGNVPSLSDIVNEGSEYTVKGKGTLARDGYNFVCWSDGTNEYYPGDTISAVNTDITLSPVWDRVIPTYTVTYLGTNSTSGSVPTLSDTVNEGSEYTVKGKGTLARDGYTFKAWTDSVNTYYPGDTITITADITLSPVWEEIPVVVTHTVTYTDNEATEGTAPSADTVTDGSRYTLKNKGTLKKSGYVFKGWKLGDTVYEAGDSIIVNTDITLTSVWEEAVINNSTNNTGSGTGNSNSTSTSTDSTNKSISADTDDNAPIIATTPVTKKVENNTMPILNNVPKKNVKVNKPVIVDTTEEAEESIEETEPVLEPVLEVTEGTIINNDVNDKINESSEVTVTNKPKEKKMPIIPISAGAATILLGIVVYAYKKNIG